MIHLIRTVTLAFFLAGATTAAADEVWTSSSAGQIVYEADLGDVAVLSFNGSRTGERAHLYVPGLGGNSTERGVFYGYWIEPSDVGECGVELTGPDGVKSTTWGQAVVMFDSTSFPSGWTAFLGSCFGPPGEPIRADL